MTPALADTKGQLSATATPQTPQVSRTTGAIRGREECVWVKGLVRLLCHIYAGFAFIYVDYFEKLLVALSDDKNVRYPYQTKCNHDITN